MTKWLLQRLFTADKSSHASVFAHRKKAFLATSATSASRTYMDPRSFQLCTAALTITESTNGPVYIIPSMRWPYPFTLVLHWFFFWMNWQPASSKSKSKGIPRKKLLLSVLLILCWLTPFFYHTARKADSVALTKFTVFSPQITAEIPRQTATHGILRIGTCYLWH